MAKMNYTDRELMQLAIGEMNKSVNEPRVDGKVPPKVGAVLLFPDGRLIKAYRGQLLEGDHAEFTLMERILPNEDLSECILYTTLEPCVKRNSPKVACCRRTTNARIKKVFVGIEDPDPTVDGKGIKHLRNHGVEVKMFDRELQKIIEQENKVFIEQALDRKRSQDQEEDLRESMEMLVPNYDKSKFSKEALQKFIDEANLKYTIADDDLWAYLAEFGAMAWNKESKAYEATGFGILLFGENPRAKYQQAVLKASVTYAGGKTESREFSESLVLVPDLVESWFYKVLPLAKNTEGFKRKDVTDYPTTVLREAIINALVHRDYEITGANSSVVIDDLSIKIISPGEPLPAISLEELNSFSAPSLRRNPIITYVFSLMNYVEESGFGMKTFKGIRAEYGLPLPNYNYNEPFLTLTFPRTPEAISAVVDNKGIEELKPDELRAYDILRLNAPISKSAFVQKTGMAQRTAERLLKQFTDLGLAKKQGKGPATKYVVVKNLSRH